MPGQTIENMAGPIMAYHGSKTLAASESVIIWTMGFPGAIGCIGGSTKSFVVSEITDNDSAIRSGDSTDIDLETYTKNTITQLKWGVSAYKIKNGASSDALTVNWRIIKP